ncbi:hypothetical protein PBRA_002356 [Plasmodiophora brassicae]|uniref:MICOS complex subunit MIC60 n=1 Tax=Plasmodiophora brassicae TaxID=37360 RepID=A0A0G4J482_PLABS|nr:hypothetical protein PBRA_002356 [Plasmodiophora brassicae]
MLARTLLMRRPHHCIRTMAKKPPPPSAPNLKPDRKSASATNVKSPPANTKPPPPSNANSPPTSNAKSPSNAGSGGGSGPPPPVVEGASKRSWFRRFLVVGGVPVVLGGCALYAYHQDERVRAVVDDAIGPQYAEVLHDAVLKVHDTIRTLSDDALKEDYQKARNPDIPPEDLEEGDVVQPGAVTAEPEPAPNDAAAQVHALLLQKEAEVRHEYDTMIEQRVMDALKSAMHLRESELKVKYEEDLIAQEKAVKAAFAEERAGRMKRMSDIEDKVDKVERILSWHQEKQRQSHKAHVLAASVITMDSALQSGSPLENGFLGLKSIDNDSAVTTALETLPADLVERGAPTLAQLQERFKVVSAACRRGALVPPDAGVVGHFLAFIFSILLVNRNYYSDGSDDISKLYRASYFLYQGDLYNAVDEIGGLEADGLPRRLAADWLADAKNRLIAVQTVQFLKAYASELATTNALA